MCRSAAPRPQSMSLGLAPVPLCQLDAKRWRVNALVHRHHLCRSPAAVTLLVPHRIAFGILVGGVAAVIRARHGRNEGILKGVLPKDFQWDGAATGAYRCCSVCDCGLHRRRRWREVAGWCKGLGWRCGGGGYRSNKATLNCSMGAPAWVWASLSRTAGSRTLANDAAVGWGGARVGAPGIAASGTSMGWPYGPITMTIWGTSAAPCGWCGCILMGRWPKFAPSIAATWSSTF